MYYPAIVLYVVKICGAVIPVSNSLSVHFFLSLSSFICILIPQTPSSIILHKKHNKHSIRFGIKLLVEIWGVRVNQILPLVFYFIHFQIAGRSYTAYSLGAVVYNIFCGSRLQIAGCNQAVLR